MNDTLRRMIRYGNSLLFIALAVGLAVAAESTPPMSKHDAKELIGKASTPEEHHRLAAYFTQKAERMEAEAVEHEELAKEYANNPGIAAHCKYFAQAARKAAAEDRALAASHESMAKTAQK